MHCKIKGIRKTGELRQQNTDFMVQRPDLGLFVVCDGVGDQQAGSLAASTAARVVESQIAEQRDALPPEAPWADVVVPLHKLLRGAVELASTIVHETGVTGKLPGLGTTLTALLVQGAKGIMAHVGNSRLYLLRTRILDQLSEDHSLLNEMKEKGHVVEEPAAAAYDGVLTRAVGLQKTVEVDMLSFDIMPQDLFLLCSDGLTRGLKRDELAQTLCQHPVERLPEVLVGLAERSGSKDDLTALVVKVQSEDSSILKRSTEISHRLAILASMTMFQHLTLKQLMKIMNLLEYRCFQAGEDVIVEGSRGGELFVVLEGTMRVKRHGSEIATLEAGTHFGEMALLNPRPRSATVQAATDARSLVLRRSAFLRLVSYERDLGIKILWNLSQELSLRLDRSNEFLTRRIEKLDRLL